MSPWLALLAFVALLACSAVFSGSETGLYSVSRVRLEAEAGEGRRAARILSRLLRDDAGLLITLLIGSNLVQDLATLVCESQIARLDFVPDAASELATTLLITPVLFLFGELLPKDLFRLRPHLLLSLTAPFLAFFRWLASPVAWPITRLADGLERLLGLRQEDFSRVLRREEMLEVLAEGRRTGALAPQAEELAHNVLVLRHTPLVRVAVPWERVVTVDLERGEAAVRAAVRAADFTRLPVLRSDARGGRVVLGYLHQLDVLGAPDAGLSGSVRPLLELAPDLPLDRAVARMQGSGQRLALLGSARAPVGLVSLTDLFATIAAQRT